MFTGMKCLQSGTVSSYFFSLLLGYVLWVGAWHAWSGRCVGVYAPRRALGPERVGRASSGAELQGDLICPSIAPESSEVSPLLHAACWCFISAMAFRACATRGTDALCPLIGLFIKP